MKLYRCHFIKQRDDGEVVLQIVRAADYSFAYAEFLGWLNSRGYEGPGIIKVQMIYDRPGSGVLIPIGDNHTFEIK